jgi:hypothetical protein
MTYSDAPREPPSYHCGNGCLFYVFETGEQSSAVPISSSFRKVP